MTHSCYSYKQVHYTGPKNTPLVHVVVGSPSHLSHNLW
jgi:hypothetical protein